MRRFGLALTGSRADADDLVQMACERALQRSGQLRDQARLDAWLYGIMRNLWIDETRRAACGGTTTWTRRWKSPGPMPGRRKDTSCWRPSAAACNRSRPSTARC